MDAGNSMLDTKPACIVALAYKFSVLCHHSCIGIPFLLYFRPG